MREFDTSYAFGNEPHLEILMQEGLHEGNWHTAKEMGVQWWQNSDPRDDSIMNAAQAGLPIVVSNPMYTDGLPRRSQDEGNLLAGVYLFPYGVVDRPS
ncbi:hypothetical protein KDA23_02700 [Candidatus Saccharibacteria bacterium]|nr:hypothetical protein [Candidatus Saccharibacteria bacterium]